MTKNSFGSVSFETLHMTNWVCTGSCHLD